MFTQALGWHFVQKICEQVPGGKSMEVELSGCIMFIESLKNGSTNAFLNVIICQFASAFVGGMLRTGVDRNGAPHSGFVLRVSSGSGVQWLWDRWRRVESSICHTVKTCHSRDKFKLCGVMIPTLQSPISCTSSSGTSGPDVSVSEDDTVHDGDNFVLSCFADDAYSYLLQGGLLLFCRINIRSPEDASLLGRKRWHYRVVISVWRLKMRRWLSEISCSLWIFDLRDHWERMTHQCISFHHTIVQQTQTTPDLLTFYILPSTSNPVSVLDASHKQIADSGMEVAVIMCVVPACGSTCSLRLADGTLSTKRFGLVPWWELSGCCNLWVFNTDRKFEKWLDKCVYVC